MRAGLQIVQDEQNNKASKIKDLVSSAELFTKENLDHLKQVQEKTETIGKQLMHRDLAIL